MNIVWKKSRKRLPKEHKVSKKDLAQKSHLSSCLEGDPAICLDAER